MILDKIYKVLLFITNNKTKTQDEIRFDIIGFIICTIVLIFGIIVLLYKRMPEWIAFLIIEYCWYIDNMQHNR